MLRDAEADRQSPAKRSRPVASGAVSPALGMALAAGLALIGIALCWLTGVRAAIVLSLIYLCVNLVYSLGAKNLPVLDVFLLASGFLIRVILGCALLSSGNPQEAFASLWGADVTLIEAAPNPLPEILDPLTAILSLRAVYHVAMFIHKSLAQSW